VLPGIVECRDVGRDSAGGKRLAQLPWATVECDRQLTTAGPSLATPLMA
jgi:hypothetical protein